MAEETENSGGGSLKSILIGLASTIALGVGGYVTKQLTGEEEKAEPAAVSAPAPVINITNSIQQAQQASGGGVKVIERVVEKPTGSAKPAPAPKPKKKEGDEFKEQAPQW